MDDEMQDQETEASDPEPVVSVAPGNTHADEPYMGTDPVYQNHANDTEAPLDAEVGPEASDQAAMAKYVEQAAKRNYEEAKEAGQNLGISGFQVPSQPEPPRTLEEIRAYDEDKARRMSEARAAAE